MAAAGLGAVPPRPRAGPLRHAGGRHRGERGAVGRPERGRDGAASWALQGRRTRGRRSSTAGGATSTRTCAPCWATRWPVGWAARTAATATSARAGRPCSTRSARPPRCRPPLSTRRQVLRAGDQWCADSIAQSGLGGITQPLIAWQNRPTYQQVVSFPAHRGDDVTNLAQGRPTAASSTQFLTGHTPDRAVDGSLGSRWASSYSDNQWLRVDLGAARSVSRAVLRWEAAHGTSYRIEVSGDGTSWTPVFATTTGNGGVDNVTFAPVTARYVRVYGVKRATSYGFSLYEFELYAR
ncbi:discoidin domain-containing protein [Micromonospora sp. M12]